MIKSADLSLVSTCQFKTFHSSSVASVAWTCSAAECIGVSPGFRLDVCVA